nr:putative RNA-dependent RNA polymerase [Setosphaeria turcica polymycovirus 2]
MDSESSFVTQHRRAGDRRAASSGVVSVRRAEGAANLLLRRMARGTVDTRDVNAVIPGARGSLTGEVKLHHVAAPGPVPPSFRTTRAPLVRIEGTEREKLEALRRFDGKGDGEVKAREFVRDSHRLDEAVELAGRLKDPSFRIYSLQRTTPMSFGGGPPGEERPLKPLGLVMLGGTKPGGGVDELYHREMKTALSMGDFTTNDPDTLPTRFLEYVHERTRSLPDKETRALKWAGKVMLKLWEQRGVYAEARGIESAEPGPLSLMMNPGAPGEFKEAGMSSRKDPEVVELLSKAVKRYYKAGHALATRGRRAKWVDFTQQPTQSFGKKERKAAKMVNGRRVAPVPRFIFSPSPVNYAQGAFLHADISHQLQQKDPSHGPGFGPGRGRAWKLLDKVRSHLQGNGSTTLDCDAIMSDISKWDANMPEVLLSASFDLIEHAVDKSKLDATGRAARSLMLDAAKRQLLVKLVEHPSGYFIEMFGCMPSGSFYTSLLNTVGNDLLALSLLAMLIMESGQELDDVDISDVAASVASDLVSYGDNQLIFSTLFSRFNTRYSPQRHAEHLAKFGMKLKVDETEVSSSLADVRFCSRGVLLTPFGLAVTRSHTSIYNKLGGTAETDPVILKMYIRALMVDLLGTDPVLYEGLVRLERLVDIPPDAKVSEPKMREMVEPFARKLFGSNDDLSIGRFIDLLRSPTAPSRSVLLSLRVAADGEGSVRGFGVSLAVSGIEDKAGLDEVGRWLELQSPSDYWAYLQGTNQMRTIFNN